MCSLDLLIQYDYNNSKNYSNYFQCTCNYTVLSRSSNSQNEENFARNDSYSTVNLNNTKPIILHWYNFPTDPITINFKSYLTRLMNRHTWYVVRWTSVLTMSTHNGVWGQGLCNRLVKHCHTWTDTRLQLLQRGRWEAEQSSIKLWNALPNMESTVNVLNIHLLFNSNAGGGASCHLKSPHKNELRNLSTHNKDSVWNMKWWER